jgi:hypothetical protein
VTNTEWKQRYKHDADFRARAIASTVASRERKLARCPEYARVLRMRTRRYQLKQSIEFHANALAKQEARLIRLVREIEKLAKKCRCKA